MLPPPRKRHGIPLPVDGQLRHTYEDTDVVFTSNKRSALLCRDVVNDSVLGASMLEEKESCSEEKCSSVFELSHDEDVGPATSMEDDDECTGIYPQLALKRKKFHVTTEKRCYNREEADSVSASNFGSYECSLLCICFHNEEMGT